MKLEPITMAGSPNINNKFKAHLLSLEGKGFEKTFYLLSWFEDTQEFKDYDDYSQKIIEGRTREKHETQPW